MKIHPAVASVSPLLEVIPIKSESVNHDSALGKIVVFASLTERPEWTSPTFEVIPLRQPVARPDGPAFLWWKQCSGGVPVPGGDNGIFYSIKESVEADFINALAKRIGLESTWRDSKPNIAVHHCSEYVPECVKRLKSQARPHHVTPEDVDWCAKQTAFRPAKRQFSVSKNRNWCPTCQEYLPETHDKANGVACEEYQKQRECEAQCAAEKEAARIAKFVAQSTAKREQVYAKERELQHLAYLLADGWAASHPEMEASLSVFAPQKLLLIAQARERDSRNGGRRINTTSFSAKDDDSAGANWSAQGDRNSRDYRGNAIYRGKHLPAASTLSVCQRCGESFARHKGTKFCSDNCRKRDHEERKQVTQPAHSKEATQ